MRPAAPLAALALTAAAIAACGGNPSASEPVRSAATGEKGVFDGAAAMTWLKRQVAYGSRPAGSKASRRLAKRLRNALPGGRYQAVPGGLRNVIGSVPGKDPKRIVVVGAHYDTKDIGDDRFVGAIDSASGTAVTVQLARTIEKRTLRSTIVFILFDGEESPRGTPDSQFQKKGLRGSKVAAPAFAKARAMILLDFVGNKNLRIPREAYSDEALWRKLRAAAATAGVLKHFPNDNFGGIEDDHLPFLKQGVPAIDLIDFGNFPCWHTPCDDLSGVAEESLDATGEALMRLLATL
jgi:glutaminyl-peptide cyclotransferase